MQQGPPTLLAEVEERTLSHDAQQELGGEERGGLQLEVLPRARPARVGSAVGAGVGAGGDGPEVGAGAGAAVGAGVGQRRC